MLVRTNVIARWQTERVLRLALAALALGVSLTNLVARVALANHIDPATATHNLAVRVTVFQCTNG